MHANADGMTTMLELVASLPRQLRESASLVEGVALPRVEPGVGAIVCGMGGSAAAATLVRGCTLDSGPRMEVVRRYRIPGSFSEDSLLVFSSYSGNTEETLAAYDEARTSRPQAPRFVITSGGELAARAESDGVPRVSLPPGLPPRASLGYGLGALVRSLAACGLLADADAALEAAALRLEEGNARYGAQVPLADNPMRRLATRLRGRLAVIYASDGLTDAVAQRWRAQINENGKALASVALLPELDHNEVVGWEATTAVRGQSLVIALRDPEEHPRVSARFDVTKDVLGKRVPHWESLHPGDGPPLVRALDLVQRGDYLSVYLAEQHGVDPVPVRVIDELKARLASLDSAGNSA